ncbi:hypothetical protein Back2_10720 [Nocardioides baekrokdamisoli]|uniref:Peptidase M60 domain-containing protein n=1 Tax=Nocardioides baekrokdamisoli TaxID=1804624 RepID=A0A3G9IL94_9ACTN|nr:ImpA family metalloprotease [Nocardioides baekrokdamisoli]BBH16785.1 hypothetical protein Back2_10720 [Nocardioides baekrokdamisoli]
MKRRIVATLAVLAALTATLAVSAPTSAATTPVLTVTPTGARIAYGTGLFMRALYRNSAGVTTDVTAKASWVSRTPALSYMHGAGQVRISGKPVGGVAVVSASYGGKTTYLKINVSTAALTSVVPAMTSKTIFVGDRFGFETLGYFVGFNEQLRWWSAYSFQPAGIVSSASGVLTGLKPGRTVVTASYRGKVSRITVTVLAKTPRIVLTKTAGNVVDTDHSGGASAGDTIPYTFSVRNTGNIPVTLTGVTDPKLGAITCTPTALAPNQIASCNGVTYTVTQADVDAQSVASTATATASSAAGQVQSQASTSTSLSTLSHFTVTTSTTAPTDADTDGLLDMGDTIHYSYAVKNTGSTTLSSVSVTPGIGGAATCPTGSVSPGATVTCTSSLGVTLAQVGAGSLSNAATASATSPTGQVGATAAAFSTTFDRMNIALQHGLPNLVSYAELVAKAQALKSAHASLAASLLPSTAMNWQFDAQGQSVSSYAMPFQQVVLRSNHNFSGGSSTADLAVAGTAPGQTTRMAYVTANPFTDLLASPRTAMPDAGMNAFDVNLLKWLLKASDLSSTSFNVKLVNTWGSTTSGTEAPTRSWFAAHAPGLHLNVSECDLPDPTCLTGADLVVFGGIGSTSDSPTIANQVKAAYDGGVPVLFMADNWYGDAPAAIAQKFGMAVDYSPVYWDHNGLQNSTTANQLPGGLDGFQQVVSPLVNTTFGTPLATSDYSACQGKDTLYDCNLGTAAFTAYQTATASWRSWVSSANTNGVSWFSQPRNGDQDLMRALVMLADKLRTGAAPSLRPGDSVPAVTYPVPTYTDGGAATRGLFVDSTTMTAWSGNQAAADTGTVYCTRSDTVAHRCVAPGWPGFGNHSLTLTSTRNDEWQATGFDAKPGVPLTVRLTSDPGLKVYVRTFFQRNGTTKSGQVDGSNVSYYDRPQFVATDWIPVTTTGTTFSSPYGGPLYVRIVGSTATSGTSVPLQFNNTATHPAVLDMTDSSQVSNFVATVNAANTNHDGAYYADLGGSGFEAHMSVAAINDALTNSGTQGRTWSYTDHGGLQQFLNDFRDQYVFTVYKMAGLQLGPNTPLANSDDPDVVTACQHFGFPCLDPSLNQRTVIQHLNYDQHAQCGDLCSGNPIDSDGSPSPAGWGENHELGHNLQRQQLNIMWADTGANGTNAAAANVWSNYSNRSGEVSNNIFPYHTAWNFYRNVHRGWGDSSFPGGSAPDTATLSRDVGGIDAFSIAQSIRLQQNNGGVLRAYDASCNLHNTTDTTATPTNIAIANAIWRNSGTYDDNNLRMSFYQQIAPLMRGRVLSDGTTLNDGYGIWTLLYQAARGWSDATSSQAKWTAAAQTTYGMSDFAWNNDAVYGSGKTVGNMIGNDFLLIELSKITGYDWRPYFQTHGALYTALANQQVIDNTPTGGYKSFNNVFPALGAQLPFANMSNIGTVDMTSPSQTWPGAYEGSATTPSYAGFHPGTKASTGATCP